MSSDEEVMLSGDGWTPSTGLPDDYDGVITEAYFTRDAKFPPDAAILKLVVQSDDPDVGEQTLLLSCGVKYDIEDNGGTLVHESHATSGKNKAYNNNSNVWQFIQSAAKSGAASVIQQRGTMWDAGVWLGLKFHFKREQYKRFNAGENDPMSSRTIVSKFYGVVDGGGQSDQMAGKPVAAQASASAQRAAANGNADTGTALIRAKLAKLATEAKDHDDFMEKAFGLDGVAGVPTVEALVMSSGPGSIWAVAQGNE